MRSKISRGKSMLTKVEIDAFDRHRAGVERQHAVVEAAGERQLHFGHQRDLSMLALRVGTPNSRGQTSASAAMPWRISSCVGLAKQSRIRLLLCALSTDHSGPGLIATPAVERRLVELHGVDVVGQLHPEEDAALRLLELRRGAELLVRATPSACRACARRPRRQFRHVLGEMRRAVFGQHHLLQRAGAGVGLERSVRDMNSHGATM